MREYVEDFVSIIRSREGAFSHRRLPDLGGILTDKLHRVLLRHRRRRERTSFRQLEHDKLHLSISIGCIVNCKFVFHQSEGVLRLN